MGVYVLSPEPSRGDYKQKLKGSVLIILGAHVRVKDQTTMQWRGPQHSGLQNKVALFSYRSLEATRALDVIRSFMSSEAFHLLFPVCQDAVTVHG